MKSALGTKRNAMLGAALAALCLLIPRVFAEPTLAFEIPQGRSCLPAARIANIKGLPSFSLASSSALNPGWKGTQAIVFNDARPALRLPLDPWAAGAQTLRIGYVEGGSYAGFAVRANGKELGRAKRAEGMARPTSASFSTEPLWACGNVLELEPDGPGCLGLVFLDCVPASFDAVPESAWKRATPLKLEAFLLNVTPYASPYAKLGSETACSFKVNGKELFRCPAGGSAMKQLENPGPTAKLEIDFEGAPGKFSFEISSLGGGRVLPELPAFMSSASPSEGCPSATLSNGLLDAVVALPDPEKGYYRGIRFEQAGMVLSLKANGREFVGGARADKHDAFNDVCGPAEEFSEAPGFDEPGAGLFLKIGVGLFERPLSKEYAFGWLYIPKTLFKWDCEAKGSSIEFRQKVSSAEGWGYEYVKRLSLPPGKPVLLIEHEFRNTGSKRIASSQYCHNYFLVDRIPPGPDYALECSFRPFFANPDASGFSASGSKVAFKGPEVCFSPLLGCDDSQGASFKLTHGPTGASISISEPFAPFRQALYSCKDGICPESFYRLDAGPGEQRSWKREIRFDSK